jgi:hypothetical protein
MRDSLGDYARINHIEECIEEIENAIQGYSFDRFCENHVLRIAIVNGWKLWGRRQIILVRKLKINIRRALAKNCRTSKHPGT